jgi:hypothetical protein
MSAVTEKEKPRFVLAAEELAENGSWQAVLAGDRERADSSSYPGPDCLLPDEVEALLSSGASLDADRAEHVTTCSGCTALLASAVPFPVELEHILRQVRPHAPAPERRPHRSMSEALAKTARMGSMVLAAGVATALAAKYFRTK